jgi:hypothetical protein
MADATATDHHMQLLRTPTDGAHNCPLMTHTSSLAFRFCCAGDCTEGLTCSRSDVRPLCSCSNGEDVCRMIGGCRPDPCR